MKTVFSFNYKYNLQWKLLNLKCNSKKIHQAILNPRINLVIILRNLKSKEIMLLSKALLFLESLALQRPFIFKIKNKNKYNKSLTSFKIKVMLNNFYSQNFIIYLFFFLMPLIFENESRSSFIYFDQNYYFIIKDFASMPGLNEDSLYWSYPVKVEFLFNHFNKKLIYKTLLELGFINYKLK